MTTSDYGLPESYCVRRDPAVFTDTPGHLSYQPLVYELALYFARRSQARYIVDIGCGSGAKLQCARGEFKLVCIDTEPTLAFAAQQLKEATFVPANLEEGLPTIAREVLEDSVVICADVIEHLRSPERLARALGSLARSCKFLLASTPDRTRSRGLLDDGPPGNPAHSMEWSADEFVRFLRANGWPPGFLAGHTVNTDRHWNKITTLVIAGREACRPYKTQNVNVAAVIHTYNEVDILEEVISHLSSEGVAVHLIDNWSTDGTFELAQRLGCTNVLRFPDRPPEQYEWHKQLEFTALYASRLDADWIIHHDADEIRCSPWRGVTLSEAIARVDELGYNAVDFTVIDFRFLSEQQDPRPPYEASLTHFQFGQRPGLFIQVKAWKNSRKFVDIASSAGHEAQFPGRKVFPLKFLTKHYPLRNKDQSNRKVFLERLPRFEKEQDSRGWHIQYEALRSEGKISGWHRNELIPWHTPYFETEFLTERLSGIGIAR